MKFTEHLWQQSKCIYHAILDHPFNIELAQGTLATGRFEYYVQQDSLYLRDYTRALALLVAKSPTLDFMQDFLSYANDGILIEQQLHDHFFNTFNISPAKEKAPACFAYTHFLLATTALEPFPVGVAALLPCFWVYRDVGLHIAKHAVEHNPYALWIETYTDPEYDKIVDRMIDIADECGESASPQIKERMTDAFHRSTQSEWAFWEAAYNMEQWPVR